MINMFYYRYPHKTPEPPPHQYTHENPHKGGGINRSIFTLKLIKLSIQLRLGCWLGQRKDIYTSSSTECQNSLLSEDHQGIIRAIQKDRFVEPIYET